MRPWLLPLAMAAALAVLRLASPYEIEEGDQAKQASYVLSVVKDGRLVLPLERGEELPTKPPLFNWIAAAFGLLLGVNDVTIRLPSVLAGLAFVLTTVWVGRRIGGPRLGEWAGVVTACTFFFFRQVAWVRTDMLHASLITLAVALLLRHRTAEGGSPRAVVLAWVVMGLGTIAKTPLAILLPVGIAMADRGIVRRGPRWRSYFPPAGVVLCLAIVLGWLIPAIRSGGREYVEVLLGESVRRAADAGSRGSKAQPVWFFVPALAAWTVPWVLWLPSAIATVRRRGRSGPLVHALLWFAIVFVVFSCSSGKRRDYILPLVPAFGLLVAGLFLERDGSESPGRDLVWPARHLAWVGIALGTAITLLPHTGILAAIHDPHAAGLLELVARRSWAVSAHGISAVVAGLLLLRSIRCGFRAPLALAGCCLLFASGAVLQQVTLAPELAPGPRYEPFVREVRKTSAGGSLEVFRVEENAVFFYLGRTRPDLRDVDAAVEFLRQGRDRFLLADEEGARELARRAGAAFSPCAGPGPPDMRGGSLVLLQGE